MLLFSLFMVSVFSITSDMNQNVVFFDNLPKDAHGQVLSKCIICEKHGADSYLINRFKHDIHSKCYDPMLEIEPAYAQAAYEVLKKQNADVEFDGFKHKAHRINLIRFAARQIKESNIESTQAFSSQYGKSALEALFWHGFVSTLHAQPFDSVCDWKTQQLSPSKFIPNGNENILK